MPQSRERRSRYSGRSGGGSTRTVGRRRVRVAVAAVLIAGLLLGGRAAQLSLTEKSFADDYQSLSSESPAESVADRGDIISADGRLLATTLDTAEVVATPYQIEAPERAARRLAEILGPSTGLSTEEIEARITRREGSELSGYSVVAEVRPEVAEKVRALGIEGITLVPEGSRKYPSGDLASQLLGYVNDDGKTYGGVETGYKKALSRGEDIQLTVDAAVQQELQSALAGTVEEYDARSATGLVMRVEDGAVVALANAPAYDNERFSEVPTWWQRNRVLTDPYEPGSTFKAFTVAAALEEEAITPSTTFTVPDSIEISDRIIHDSLPHKTKTMNPQDILQESSNVGAIKIGRKLGGGELNEHIRRFEFGERAGIGLPGESTGKVPAHEDWSGSSIATVPMGHGFTATPLQLAAGYAAIAGGGTTVTPHVVQRGDNGEPGPRVISRETSDIVSGMLESVVDDGTARQARIPGYTVAGKTGTTQKVNPETGNYGDEYIASFIGFAPADDPEYLTLIAVNEPDVIWGEQVAAPAFQKVMSFALGYSNVPPDRSPDRRRTEGTKAVESR